MPLNIRRNTTPQGCSAPPQGYATDAPAWELKERVTAGARGLCRKDSGKWVIFPRLSHANHRMIEARNPFYRGGLFKLTGSNLPHREEGNTVKGIITHGISYGFVMEALNGYRGARVLKVSTPNPMPEPLLLEFCRRTGPGDGCGGTGSGSGTGAASS